MASGKEDCFYITYATMDEDPRIAVVERQTLEKLLDDNESVMPPRVFALDREWTTTNMTTLYRPIGWKTSCLLQGWPRKTFWINRTCDAKRRETMFSIFDTIQSMIPEARFVRIEAIDGSDPEVRASWPLARYFRAVAEKIKKKNDIHHNEKTVALTLSHFKALETAWSTRSANQNDHDWFMVLEDDFCLDHLTIWPCSIGQLFSSLENDVGLCSFSRLFRLREEFFSPTTLVENIRYYGTTLGYAVRYGAVPAMIQTFYATSPEKLYVSDHNVFHTVQMSETYKAVMTTTPWFTTAEENQSTIHADHENFQKECKEGFRKAFFPHVDFFTQKEEPVGETRSTN